MKTYTDKELLLLVKGLSDDTRWIERCKNMELGEAIRILKDNGFKITMKPKGNEHICTSCEKPYRKADYAVCPHCGGDGGGTTPRVWKPNKHQRKEYAKKMSEN